MGLDPRSESSCFSDLKKQSNQNITDSRLVYKLSHIAEKTWLDEYQRKDTFITMCIDVHVQSKEGSILPYQVLMLSLTQVYVRKFPGFDRMEKRCSRILE